MWFVGGFVVCLLLLLCVMFLWVYVSKWWWVLFGLGFDLGFALCFVVDLSCDLWVNKGALLVMGWFCC